MQELATDDKRIQFLDYLEDRETKINVIAQSIIDKNKAWEELGKIDKDFGIAYQLMEGTRKVDINYKTIGLPSKMTIGVEIEAEGKISEILPEAIGIWEAKQEDSLQYGIEYVTKEPINDNESSIYEIYRINEILKAVGMETSERCGGHVHIGADYITSEEGFKELLELWGNAEKVYYLISNKPGELPRKGIEEYSEPISKYLQSADIGDLGKDEFVEEAKRYLKSSKDRSLNLLNVNNGKNTIEFRLSNGTLDGDTWIENIHLYGRTVEIAQKLGEISEKLENKEEIPEEEKRLYRLKERLKQNISLDEKMEILMEILFHDEEERKVYQKRYEKNRNLDRKVYGLSRVKFGKVDFGRVYQEIEIPEGIINDMKLRREENKER